jgi:hypothetical protein
MPALLDFIIFNFKTTINEAKILKKFPVSSQQFIKLLLLKLKLFIKYEGKFIMLSVDCFSLLKILVLNFLNSIPQSCYEDEETIKVLCLLLSVSSKIYLIKDKISEQKKITEFEISLVQNSLLSNIRETLIIATTNFWKSFFNFKFHCRHTYENSNKLKVICIAESMIFYHFYLSLNIELSTSFVETCMKNYSLNMRLIKNSALQRLGQVLYTITEFYNKQIPPKVLTQSRCGRICFVFKLTAKAGLLDRSMITQVLSLNHQIKKEISKEILEVKLKANLNDLTIRKQMWLKYVDISNEKKAETDPSEQKDLSEQMRDQINIDVVRTKLWKGEVYQDRIRDLMMTYLKSKNGEFEYFQGFNYITSFFAEIFDSKDEFLKIMDYISTSIFPVRLLGVFQRAIVPETQPAALSD